MNHVVQPENAAENCQTSGKYAYSLHPAATLTLQIFNTQTMSSAFFTAEETLTLLDYLAEHRSHITAVARNDANEHTS